MTVDAEVYGIFILIFYSVGMYTLIKIAKTKKVNKYPIIGLGSILMFIPPIALLYFMILVFMPDKEETPKIEKFLLLYCRYYTIQFHHYVDFIAMKVHRLLAVF